VSIQDQRDRHRVARGRFESPAQDRRGSGDPHGRLQLIAETLQHCNRIVFGTLNIGGTFPKRVKGVNLKLGGKDVE
jgi:hypothetical protein